LKIGLLDSVLCSCSIASIAAYNPQLADLPSLA
jgi:hypothetical protein